MGSENTSPWLILFAKAPIIGKVKTRLCPPLNLEQASKVATELIEISLSNANKHWPGQIELCVWPSIDHIDLINLSEKYDAKLTRQTSGDLGVKMYRAIENKLKDNSNCVLVGCDIPAIDRKIYHTAYQAVIENKNVIGPTFDGGYYLIGINKINQRMFKQIDWGSEHAYKQTISRCNSLDIKFDLVLPKLNDLDNYNDLCKLAETVKQLDKYIIC